MTYEVGDSVVFEGSKIKGKRTMHRPQWSTYKMVKRNGW